MRSGKSYFSATLFRKNIVRFWPIWGAYLAAWIFLLPMGMSLDLGRYAEVQKGVAHAVYSTLSGVLPGLALVFGILAAMAVFSYLYSARSVHMLHALPVTRECLFVTNYLSGLLFLVGPLWLAGLITLPVLAAQGIHVAGVVLLWMALSALEVFFFYSFAVFCAMFTGHILALPAFYAILNFLAFVLLELLNGLFYQFIYGYARADWLGELSSWLTPVLRMVSDVRCGGENALRFDGIPTILLYALVGAALTALALAAYRRRKLESAGDVVAVSWVRPIFKYGVAFSAAVTLGSLLCDVTLGGAPHPAAVILCLLIAGLAGYFAAEMLLKKSFKVFRRSWKGAAVFCAALALTGGALELDLIGYNRAPGAGAVRSVTISDVYTMPQDNGTYAPMTFSSPEEIEAVLRLHRALAGERERAEGGELRDSGERELITLEDGTELDVWTGERVNIRLDYTLESGRVLHRSYNVPVYTAELAGDGTVAALLDALINWPGRAEELYYPALQDLAEMEGAALVDAAVSLYHTETGGQENVHIGDSADRARLLEAIRQDLADGGLGRRYLFSDLERQENCAVGDIMLTFFVPDREVSSVVNGGQTYTHAVKEENTVYITITPQITARRTIALLEELGVMDGTRLMVTHAEESAVMDKYGKNTGTEEAWADAEITIIPVE